MNNLRQFKLDSTILNDFDGLMEKHLDYVEELTVSNIPNDSRIINIISLCINIKSLIVEGDYVLQINNVLLNVCKPDRLERLVLNGTKLPNSNTIKKFRNLKMVSLNNIRFCDVKSFLKDIENPEKIEAITLDTVDMARNSLGELSTFTNLKYLNILHVENCSFSKIDALMENNKLRRVNIEKNEIQIADIKNLLKGNAKKNIILTVPSKNNNIKNKNQLELESGYTTILLNSSDLDEFISKVPMSKIDNMLLIVNDKIDFEKYINSLKLVTNIVVAIKDTSYLSVKQAYVLRNELAIEQIYILDFDGVFHQDNAANIYQIDRYIQIREEIDNLISRVEDKKTALEKVLELYRILCETISYDEFIVSNVEGYAEVNKVKSSNLENGLIEKQCGDSGFAEIFMNVVKCMGYDSNIICGNISGFENTRCWNQIKIDGYWYNLNISLDSRTITNSNVFGKNENYCLVSDNDFYKTHTPTIGDPKECKYTVNQKSINTFFKTGVYTPDGKGGLWLIIMQKIRSLFAKKPKALPEAEDKC